MSKMSINIGNSANDGNGEPARSAFNKTNKNFDEIYSYIGDGTNLNKLGTASSANVGLASGQVPTSDFVYKRMHFNDLDLNSIKASTDSAFIGFVSNGTNTPDGSTGHFINLRGPVWNRSFQLWNQANQISSALFYRANMDDQLGLWHKILSSANTTTDGNGFIKAASPIVKLFADKIELNNEAAEQNITFEKIEVGHYLIKGSSGFAQQGWYIETPKDANGNILFAVNYEQLENGDIEVKTYKKKFDLDSASIVADLENPVDIILNRWIDIRLQEVPKPVPEMPTEEVNSDEPQQ